MCPGIARVEFQCALILTLRGRPIPFVGLGEKLVANAPFSLGRRKLS